MLKILIAVTLLYPCFGRAWAQEPPKLPKPSRTSSQPAAQNERSIDPVLNYASPRRAGLVAFKVAVELARKPDTERSIELFLESLKREPSLVKALYNLGVECAIGERWTDALQFYSAYGQQPGVDAKALEPEIRRVTDLSKMSAKRRDYLKEFLPLVDEKDWNKAIGRLEAMSVKYPQEWEAPALKGVDLARLGRFRESIEALQTAARLARPELRPRLTAAADIAQKEVDFADRLSKAEQARQNAGSTLQFEAAAKLYREAWKINPDRADLAMNAATADLMADNLDQAANDLDTARAATDPEISTRAVKMLAELGKGNPDVAKLAKLPVSAPGQSGAGRKSTADQIVEQVGALKSPELLSVQAPAPPLLEEQVDDFPMPEDLKVFRPDWPPDFRSTDSIFEIYKKNLQEAETRRLAAQGDQGGPDAAPAPMPGPAPETVVVRTPAPAARRSSDLTEVVTIVADPPDANIVVDEKDPSPQPCSNPCQISLPLGRHTAMVTLEGYRDRPIIIDEKRGSQSLHVALEKKGAMLRMGDPPGIVRIDGTVLRPPCPCQIFANAGTHEISIEVDGQITRETITVEDQRDRTFWPKK